MPSVTNRYGELESSADGRYVRCHVCGGWFRQLHHAHLRTHGLTSDEYRARHGLRPRHPLMAPELVEMRRDQMRRQLADDPRIQAGLRHAQALVRSGKLVEPARRHAVRRAETERRWRETMQARAPARVAARRAEREERARALGYAGLRELLDQLYVHDAVSQVGVQRLLRVGQATLIADLEWAGLADVARARRALRRRTAWRRRRLEELQARLALLGFDSFEACISACRERRWTQRRIAEELAIHPDTLRRLMHAERGSAALEP